MTMDVVAALDVLPKVPGSAGDATNDPAGVRGFNADPLAQSVPGPDLQAGHCRLPFLRFRVHATLALKDASMLSFDFVPRS